MQELSNESCLSDHGVTAGSTLRLVLSMRGGPISTRRLASTEHHLAWREIKEYVDTTRYVQLHSVINRQTLPSVALRLCEISLWLAFEILKPDQ